MAVLLAPIERHMREFGDYWGPRVEDATTVADQATALNVMGLSAPHEREPNWRSWNVEELNPKQCKLAAEFAKEQACWENVKTAALIALGIAASVLLYAAMLFVAGSIVVYMMSAFAFALDSIIIPLVGEGTLLFFAAFIPLDLKLTWEIFNVGAGVAAIAPRLWTKEFIPAIQRSSAYATHLTQEARKLEFAGVGARV